MVLDFLERINAAVSIKIFISYRKIIINRDRRKEDLLEPLPLSLSGLKKGYGSIIVAICLTNMQSDMHMKPTFSKTMSNINLGSMASSSYSFHELLAIPSSKLHCKNLRRSSLKVIRAQNYKDEGIHISQKLCNYVTNN